LRDPHLIQNANLFGDIERHQDDVAIAGLASLVARALRRCAGRDRRRLVAAPRLGGVGVANPVAKRVDTNQDEQDEDQRGSDKPVSL